MQGQPCPDFIYPNVDDHDYVKVQLDPRSLETAKKYLSQIKDPLTRIMVWNNLYEMVRDNKLKVNDFLALLLQHLPKENNQMIVDSLAYRPGSIIHYLPKSTPEQQKKRTEAVAQLEQMCLNQFNHTKSADLKKIWWDTFVSIAETPSALEKITEVLNGKSKRSY